MKLSYRFKIVLILFTKKLYAIKAGIAANKPSAVAIKASDIPGATTERVA